MDQTMDSTYVLRQVRRCSRNLLFVNAIGMLVLLLLFLFSQRYLYNCFRGPMAVTPAQLGQMALEPERERFLAVRDRIDTIPTGLWKRERGSPFGLGQLHYFYARVGSRVLLVQSPEASPAGPLEGRLTDVPDDIRRSLLEANQGAGSAFEASLLPLMFDTSNYRTSAFLFLPLGMGAFFLLALQVKKALDRLEDMERCPVYQRICKIGDPGAVARHVEEELTSSGWHRYGDLVLTPSWLLHETFFGFRPIHVTDLVWIYPTRTRRYWHFIPIGKSHGVVAVDAAGEKAKATYGSWDSADRFIRLISAQVPWAITGYNHENALQHQLHRDKFLETVAERKRRYYSRKTVAAGNG